MNFRQVEELLEELLDDSENMPKVNHEGWVNVDFLGDVEESKVIIDSDQQVPFMQTEEAKVQDAVRFLKKFKIEVK